MASISATEYSDACAELDRISENLPRFDLDVEGIKDIAELVARISEALDLLKAKASEGYKLADPVHGGYTELISTAISKRVAALENTVIEWEKKLDSDAEMVSWQGGVE